MRDLLVILVVVLLVFGAKKLRIIGSDLGAAVKAFRKGYAGEVASRQPATATSEQPDAEFPEVAATRERARRDGA